MTEFDQPAFQFEVPAGEDPIGVYLASSLTGLDGDRLKVVELVSSVVWELCSKASVRVHAPMRHTSPRKHPDLSPEEVHAQDYRQVLSSDALIVLGDYPSFGAGKEVVWAERLRIPILVLVHEADELSRLIRGGTGDIDMYRWRDVSDIRDAWNAFFLRRRGSLEAHRKQRANRALMWGPVLSRLADRYRALSTERQEEVRGSARLESRRIEELLASPLAIAEASADELVALSGALGLPTTAILPGEPDVQLSSQQLQALEVAAEVQGWTGKQTAELQRFALTELAKGGTRRFRLTSPEDWIRLAER